MRIQLPPTPRSPLRRRSIPAHLLAALLLATACSDTVPTRPEPAGAPPAGHGALAAESGGGALANGGTASGSITTAGQTDSWTFSASQGDYLVVSMGEVSGSSDFTPWLRLIAPNGALADNHWSAAAAQVAVSATQTGTYTVIVGTADSGYDGTGSYKLRLAQAPDSFVVPSGDEGGPMTKGTLHPGKIVIGDLDLWSFNATQGSAVTVHITEVTGSSDFTPWVRLFGPDGKLLGSQWGASAAQIGLASAPQSGKYTVVVGTADSGYDGTGSYQVSVQGAGVASTSTGAARIP